jgi:peptidoglycan/LPS O-acetylase OafA/YrhL
MTAGYALILWNVVSSGSWFRDVLSRPVFTVVGRWSYSLYLWHWWPTAWISGELAQRLGSGPLVQHVSLVLCLALLLPFSWLSYRLLEQPYFQERPRAPLVPEAAAPRLKGE